MIVVGLFAGSGCATAAAVGAIVTPGAPAELPLARLPASDVSGANYIEVTVQGYRPATDGVVQIVVELPDGGGTVEIGRFGLFPELAFTAAQPERAQRFGFPLDPRLTGTAPATVRIRLVPTGVGRDATADVTARLMRRD